MIRRAQELNRRGRTDDALSILDALVNTEEGNDLSTRTARVHILLSQRRLAEAAQEYEKILTLPQGERTATHNQLELGLLYLKLRDVDRARGVAEKLAAEAPSHLGVQRLLQRIRLSEQGFYAEADFLADVEEGDEGDLSLERLQVMASPMLAADVVGWQFHDALLLRNNRVVTEADAQRLLDRAMESKEAGFGERYPLYLEAAKAYSQLPQSDNLQLALSRYAMMRAGALATQFDRTPEQDLSVLTRLRDSILSYYRESLRLNHNLKNPIGRDVPVKNGLRVALTLTALERRVPVALNRNRDDFEPLVAVAFDGAEELLSSLFDSVLFLASARPASAGTLAKALAPWIASLRARDESRYRHVLEAVVSESLAKDSNRLLNKSAVARLRAIQAAERFFERLRAHRFDPDNGSILLALWGDRPTAPGVFTPTDEEEFLKPIESALRTLSGITRRSPEERHVLLNELRARMEHLAERADAIATYWGRSQVEPLLETWLEQLRAVERRSALSVAPQVDILLDPPYFSIEGDGFRGDILIRNSGRGAASHCDIELAWGPTDLDRQIINVAEVPAGGTASARVLIPGAENLSESRGKTVSVTATVHPMLAGRALKYSTGMTLDVADPPTFAAQDIVWDYNRTPSERMFKGRWRLIDDLIENHFSSSFERTNTLVLYGLTRTGKSSILTYLARKLSRLNVGQEERNLLMPVEVSLDAVERLTSSIQVVDYFVRALKRATEAMEPTTAGALGWDCQTWAEWENLVRDLRTKGLTPVFLIDEFTYFANLFDKQLLGPSFLAMVRKQAFASEATFVLAGTYDITDLIRDPTYGITGQLVNAKEIHVNRIDEGSAHELVRAMEPRLRFTEAAAQEILRLSDSVPYFVQRLCRECASYSLKTSRSIIGSPDVTRVVEAMITQAGGATGTLPYGVRPLESSAFQNNMFSPHDPPEFEVVIGSIARLTQDEAVPRFVTLGELLAFVQQDLQVADMAAVSAAIDRLKERGVLVAGTDDEQLTLRISVDLFRRYWLQHHNADLELKAGMLRELIAE